VAGAMVTLLLAEGTDADIWPSGQESQLKANKVKGVL